jgi:dihydrofolate reductase
MRKLTSFLFISLDGVVESPNRFVRDDLYQDFDPFIEEGIAEQDAVLLGRKQYEEWSVFWPESKIEPFAAFINSTQKHVVSRTPMALDWHRSTLLSGDLRKQVTALKSQPGKTIGVHGSISLVQSLLIAGLLDELRFLLIPAVAGQGRRLLSHDGDPIQLNLQSARTTPHGLQYLVYRPRL